MQMLDVVLVGGISGLQPLLLSGTGGVLGCVSRAGSAPARRTVHSLGHWGPLLHTRAYLQHGHALLMSL